MPFTSARPASWEPWFALISVNTPVFRSTIPNWADEVTSYAMLSAHMAPGIPNTRTATAQAVRIDQIRKLMLDMDPPAKIHRLIKFDKVYTCSVVLSRFSSQCIVKFVLAVLAKIGRVRG